MFMLIFREYMHINDCDIYICSEYSILCLFCLATHMSYILHFSFVRTTDIEVGDLGNFFASLITRGLIFLLDFFFYHKENMKLFQKCRIKVAVKLCPKARCSTSFSPLTSYKWSYNPYISRVKVHPSYPLIFGHFHRGCVNSITIASASTLISTRHWQHLHHSVPLYRWRLGSQPGRTTTVSVKFRKVWKNRLELQVFIAIPKGKHGFLGG